MTFTQLKYFISVMDEKNFTKASKILFTSQPNVSKQISLLEEELGVLLFHRLNTGVIPTPAADQLYVRLSKLLKDFDQLMSEIKRLGAASDIKQTLSIGLCQSMAVELILPGFFDSLKKTMPQISVFIQTYPPEELMEKLISKEFDIIFLFSVYELNYPDVERIPLNRKNEILYYSKSSHLYGKMNLTIYDFKDETFVQPIVKNHFYNPYKILPFKPKKIIGTNSTISAFINIESNNAVGIFGQSHYFVGHQNIASLEIKNQENMVGTDAVWLSHNNNANLRNFTMFLKDYLKNKNECENGTEMSI